jgi:hypothetical protein
MRNRFAAIGVISAVLSLLAAFLSTPGSGDQFRFKIGYYDRQAEEAAIQDTLALFRATLAGFYMTGGNVAGLNMFPAEKMLKRNIFKDININLDAGRVLVMDRDRIELKQIVFSDRNHATAVFDETWFMQFQNAGTRRPLSGNKANLITARYFLKKMWSRWVVISYEVYGREDILPPVDEARFIAW